MELAVFEKILASIPPGSPVSLQGEGEPLLWPHFEDVLQRYGDRYQFETITNGTIKKDLSKLRRLGISIDSLNEKVSQHNGRTNLDKVMGNTLVYRHTLSCKIRILTVDYGQNLTDLKQWCQFFGLDHIVQSVQPKADYVKVYGDRMPIKVIPIKKAPQYKCGAGFVGKPMYWNVDGLSLPCCFTKDLEEFHDCANVYKRMRIGITPASCNGCQHLIPVI